jgi:GNAT superfamily N-acetyltransferase
MISSDKQNPHFIEPITDIDKSAVLNLFGRVFSPVMSTAAQYINAVTDWNESRLIRIDGKVAGAYALFIRDIPYLHGEKEDTNRYRTGWRKGKGVEGIALAVEPEYLGKGIGKKLREYPESTGRFAYSWGRAYKSLNNLDQWLKHRRLVYDSDELNFTLRDHQAIAFDQHFKQQSTNYDCGPTCLWMLSSYLHGKVVDYLALLDQTGCNPVSGTIGSGMERGLKKLDIPFIRNPLRDQINSFNLLDKSLQAGCPFIVRTLTKGIKHWTIVYAKTSVGNYLLADPSLGLHSVTALELNLRWEPRQYDGFAVV